MFRVLILLVVISSCEKDNFIGNSVEPVNFTESTKGKKVYPKKRKIRLFKRKTCKVPK